MSHKKVFTLLVLLTSIQYAKAGLRNSRFETDENGYAKAPAEFLGFTINAASHCHANATQANQAIRDLSTKIEKALEPFLDPTAEQGAQKFLGTSARADLVKYENHVPTTICSGWQSRVSYFIKITKVENAPAFQDAVLELNPPQDPKLEIALSEPRAGIFSKTYENLVDKALQNAHKKAIRRVGVLLSDMPQFKESQLISVSSSKNAAGSVSYDQTGLGGDPSISATESVYVSITRNFAFELK